MKVSQKEQVKQNRAKVSKKYKPNIELKTGASVKY
jgi:hypothetical protein